MPEGGTQQLEIRRGLAGDAQDTAVLIVEQANQAEGLDLPATAVWSIQWRALGFYHACGFRETTTFGYYKLAA